jgi:hypothetical protein
VIQRRNELNDL